MSNDLSQKIYQLRKRQGLTLEQVADIVGVGKSTVRKWETGMIANMRRDKIALLAKALHTTPAYLMGWNEHEYSEQNTISSSAIRIPVLGYVAAGIPISAIEDIIDYEELAPDMVKDGAEYFALQIKGQSMEPKISDGDVVIVRKQPDVDSGQIAIVCVNGDEATCKKIMKQDSGILLLPLNPTFAPTFYSNEDIERIPITILGRVVELRAKF